MKKNIAAVFVVLVLALAAHAQSLEAVLNSMDKAAAEVKTAQTEFVWDQFERVVGEHDYQQGTMYFRRQATMCRWRPTSPRPTRSTCCLPEAWSAYTCPKPGRSPNTTPARTKPILRPSWCWD